MASLQNESLFRTTGRTAESKSPLSLEGFSKSEGDLMFSASTWLRDDFHSVWVYMVPRYHKMYQEK